MALGVHFGMTVQAVSIEAESPVSLLNEGGQFPALVVCEHASNFVPADYAGLGVSTETLQSHVAWDPGADEVARALSAGLDAPYARGEISRLVYDCNRPPSALDAMPEKSEIFEIPGNRDLSSDERSKRIVTIYEPFRACLAASIRERADLAALITIHSFTPVYRGERRSVELGILHDTDSRLADRMLENAQHHTEFEVRRNEPYGPDDGVTHTLREHGLANGLLNVMIEIRNDLVASPQDCRRMGKLLQDWIGEALSSLGVPARGKVVSE